MSAARHHKISWWWPLVGLILAVALLATIDQWRLSRARKTQPTGSAEWIWGRGHQPPDSFYLVRDFEIDSKPTSAELQILGDEAYVAYLNGIRIGSNRYRGDHSVNRYEVVSYLRLGANRIAVRVEITRLRGGLLARLVADPGQPHERELVVSDEDWLTLPEQPRHGFSDPEVRLRPLPKAVVLGPPPRGRWGWLELASAIRPRHEQIVLRGADGRQRRTARAHSFRTPQQDWSWLPKGRRQRRLGDWVEFSWNEPQTGYFGIKAVSEDRILGLVYYGMQSPDLSSRAPDAVAVGVRGREWWEDTVIRKFRYAVVLGVSDVVDGAVFRMAEDIDRWNDQDSGVAGVLPPASAARLRSSVEEEVWSRLQGIPGGTAR